MPACYNELRRGKHIMRKLATKITAVVLMLSVIGMLASCQKVEADYVLLFQNSNDSYYYAIKNDELRTLSALEYGSVASENSGFSKCNTEIGTLSISAEGDDPAEWEYKNELNELLDDEQLQFWIPKITAMDVPYRGTLSVLFYKFDDYSVVHVWKFGLGTEQTVAVFHGDEITGTIEDKALLSKVYKK